MVAPWGKPNRARVALVLGLGALIGLTVGAASSAAAPIGLGAVPTEEPEATCNGPADVVQSRARGVSNPYIVPREGRIISWSTYAIAGAGQEAMLKVFRPIPRAADNYTVVAHDGPRVLTPSSLSTFPTGILVEAGDYIGFNSVNSSSALRGACVFRTFTFEDIVGSSTGSAADGSVVEMPLIAGTYSVNVAAVLQPQPTVIGVSPNSGPGDNTVTITGTDFRDVVAVNFGSHPAAAFTVVSETEISAVAPAGIGAGTVDVGVVTPAGASPTGAQAQFTFQFAALDRITYAVAAGGGGGESAADRAAAGGGDRAACQVPRLQGKALKAIRKALNAAHCALGKVMGPKGGAATVKKQSPKAGKALAAGTKVNVTLEARG